MMELVTDDTSAAKDPALRCFFNDLPHLGVDQELLKLWTYEAREVGDITYRELRLVGSSAIIQESSDKFGFSVIVMQTQEHRVYQHVAFMLSHLLRYFVRGTKVLHLQFLGLAYQSFMVLDTDAMGFHVDLTKLEGMLEIVNRHGQPQDREISKITGALIKLKRK